MPTGAFPQWIPEALVHPLKPLTALVVNLLTYASVENQTATASPCSSTIRGLCATAYSHHPLQSAIPASLTFLARQRTCSLASRRFS
ncbi:hypothetical protein ACFXTI_029824 [Malus domestica]